MKIILPLHVLLPRKKGPDKIWILNLNSYRNTHFQILNQAKQAYKDKVADALDVESLFYEPPYVFHYKIYPGNKRAFDIANVLPIIQKFTDDALIDLGVIPDDSWKVIRAVEYSIGEVDKESPRAELEILPYLKPIKQSLTRLNDI